MYIIYYVHGNDALQCHIYKFMVSNKCSVHNMIVINEYCLMIENCAYYTHSCLHNNSNSTFADWSKNKHNKDNNQENQQYNKVDDERQVPVENIIHQTAIA